MVFNKGLNIDKTRASRINSEATPAGLSILTNPRNNLHPTALAENVKSWLLSLIMETIMINRPNNVLQTSVMFISV